MLHPERGKYGSCFADTVVLEVNSTDQNRYLSRDRGKIRSVGSTFLSSGAERKVRSLHVQDILRQTDSPVSVSSSSTSSTSSVFFIVWQLFNLNLVKGLAGLVRLFSFSGSLTVVTCESKRKSACGRQRCSDASALCSTHSCHSQSLGMKK